MKHPTLLAHDHSDLDGLLAAACAALAAYAIEQSFATVDVFWARLAMHIRAEHLHLFPTVLRAVEAAAQKKEAGAGPPLELARNTVVQLEQDHDYFMRALAGAVKELRTLREPSPADTAATFRNVQETILAVSRRLEAHNELEESQLYQWGVTLLEPPEQAALKEKIECELENLPPRFMTNGQPSGE